MKPSKTHVELHFPTMEQPVPATMAGMRDGHVTLKLTLEVIPQRLLKTGCLAMLRLHNESAQLEMKSEIVDRGANWLKLRMPEEAIMTKKRSHARILLNTPVKLRSLDDPDAEPIDGVGIDLSLGGMQLILHAGRELPETVSVEFELFEEDIPIKTTARIAWFKVFKESYLRVGLQFLDLPRIDQLRVKRMTEIRSKL